MNVRQSAIPGYVLYGTACIFLVLLFHAFQANRKYFGRLSRKDAWQMIRFVWYSRSFVRIVLPSLLVPFGVLFWLLSFRSLLSPPLIAVFAFGIAQSAFLIGKSFQPPAALLLASSSPDSADLLNHINKVLSPLRCVAMLEPSQMNFLQRNAIGDNLRARNPQVWKSIVHKLMKMVPIVILDTRGDGEGLRQESFILLEPARVGRVLFIVEDNGKAPALEFHGIRPDEHALICIKRREIIPYLRDRKDAYAPSRSPGNLERIKSGEVVRENWKNMPSTLLIELIDFFSSKEVIRQALGSGKQLLCLWSPLTDLERKNVDLSIEFAWEFVHNPNLAMMVFNNTKRAYIRIDFLQVAQRELSEYSAVGYTLPLTWEQLNRPEPIWNSMQGFLSEATVVARRMGLEVRQLKH